MFLKKWGIKMYKEYFYGAFKEKIKALLRKRLSLKDRIRFHLKKIEYHKDKIKFIQIKMLPEIEKELNLFLKRVGN